MKGTSSHVSFRESSRPPTGFTMSREWPLSASGSDSSSHSKYTQSKKELSGLIKWLGDAHWIPPSEKREMEADPQSYPFNITLRNVEGIPVDGKPTDGSGNPEYQLRLSLFDVAYKQFFGRTWVGPLFPAKTAAGKLKLSYNQNLYFHTPYNDESIVVVLEIISVNHMGDGKMQQTSCGWGVFRVFRYEGDMLDTSSSAQPPIQKMNIYYGSPRALLYMEEPIEKTTGLSTISGCQVLYTIRTHRYMQKAMHLIPENVLVGTNDVVPGVLEGQRDPKNPSAGIDNLRKPKLLKSAKCFIERISINLNPSIEKFEEELCRMLNDDRVNRELVPPEGGLLQILKRSMRIGVHNGWTYIAEPEEIQLSADSGSSNFKRTSSFKKGHQRTGSTGSIGSASTVKEIGHKNRVDIDGMVEDPAIALVFTLVYEVGDPPKKMDKKASIAHSSFHLGVRWAAFCPFNNQQPLAQHTIALLGGPNINPEEMFMFQSGDAIGSSVSLSGLASGNISFAFNLVGKENIPYSTTNTLTVPGMRPGSQMSLGGASSVLQESGQSQMAQLMAQMSGQMSGRPPLPPGSSRQHHQQHIYPEQSMQQHQQLVPPLQGVGTSPRVGGYPSPHPGVGHHGVAGHHTAPAMYQTPRGYYPLEVQHHTDPGTPQISARVAGGQELQELPFTPMHAPIMAVAPGMQSGQGLSRAAYAKLYTAGFPSILDRKGEAPEVVDPSEEISYIGAREEADRLQANEIYLQFLAFSRMLTFENTKAKTPSTVFFTFQFYRFPQVTTERLLLGNVEGDLSSDPNSLPCLLQKLDKDGGVMKGSPGYQIKYHVDPAYLKPGEGRLFVQHLAEQTLHIDVWDGDSLHLIGSCSADLKHMCRQGRQAVQVTYELDVYKTEYIERDTLGGGMYSQNVKPVDVNNELKGRLHLRLANVGHPADPKVAKTNTCPPPAKPKVVVSGGGGNSQFMGGSLNAVKNPVKELGRSRVCKAQPLTEMNQELANVLYSRKEKKELEETGTGKTESERKRKLARLHAVKRVEGHDDPPIISTIRAEKDEKARDLKTIEIYRQQSKKEGILSMLSQAISTEHTVHPSLGNTQFFEFQLKNPYNVEHTVVVDCDDPELSVITDPREWRHFKVMNEIFTAVEEGMFNLETKSGKPEIFLRPKEIVSVPFKFLSFKADHTVQPQAPSDPHKPQTKRGFFTKNKEDPLSTRVARVHFNTQDNKPIAILAVRVEPQPHIIDQTFRFHHPEQSFLKKSIRIPPLQNYPGMPVGGPGLHQVYVRCSDPNVICESRKVSPGEPHDIFFKVACGASPQVKKFFISVYNDPYLSRPVHIWQFYIHAMQRVDVQSVEGQTSRFTLTLRGTQASRLIQCYSSNATEMEIHPKDPFMLAANTLQEIHVGVRPLQPGSKFLYINVVDIEYHQLIRSWLVCVTCKTPSIGKAFEIKLPVGGGKGSNKRIDYSNPYPNRKVFLLNTNRPDLLQFKETRMEIGAGEKHNIGLRFAPSMMAGSNEILVFINDEDDKNEETFCIKAIYQ